MGSELLPPPWAGFITLGVLGVSLCQVPSQWGPVTTHHHSSPLDFRPLLLLLSAPASPLPRQPFVAIFVASLILLGCHSLISPFSIFDYCTLGAKVARSTPGIPFSTFFLGGFSGQALHSLISQPACFSKMRVI